MFEVELAGKTTIEDDFVTYIVEYELAEQDVLNINKAQDLLDDEVFGILYWFQGTLTVTEEDIIRTDMEMLIVTRDFVSIQFMEKYSGIRYSCIINV